MLLCGFSQEECRLGLAPPSDKSPRSHAVLGAHSWGPSAHALAAPSPSCLACCGRALHTGHADPVSQPKDSVLAAHATWPRMRQLLSWRVYSFCFFVLVALSSFFLFPSEWIGLLVTVKHEEKGWRVGEGVVGALRDASGWLHSRGFQLGRAQSRV